MVHAYMGQLPAEFAGDLDIFCKPLGSGHLRVVDFPCLLGTWGIEVQHACTVGCLGALCKPVGGALTPSLGLQGQLEVGALIA